MSHKSNQFWTFVALPASLVILAAAYYVRVASVREAIDARTPIVRKLLGRFVSDPTVVVENSNLRAPAPTPPPADSLVATSPVAGGASTNPAPPTPRVFSLQELSRDRSLWPKKVTLKKPATFPAVVGGKVVGNIVAPTGTEATMVAIKDGQLGLEYGGGGAWVAAEDTDLGARVPLRN
jgi:hypothetical protein